ncbi:hypothetical protein [Campylobacter hyointestinalis]|nr:hypothetical protein [Campylobacter hyointestinalis]
MANLAFFCEYLVVNLNIKCFLVFWCEREKLVFADFKEPCFKNKFK